MSGYEKYVAQAADEIQRVVYGTVLPEMSGERENSTEAALAALAVVGPLIEEDTRDRMVTAAGRALEMDVSHKPDGLYYCATSGEIEQYPGGGFDVCCALGPAGHEPISEIALRAARKQVAEEIAQALEARRAVHHAEQVRAQTLGRSTIGYIAMSVDCQMAADEARKIGGQR